MPDRDEVNLSTATMVTSTLSRDRLEMLVRDEVARLAGVKPVDFDSFTVSWRVDEEGYVTGVHFHGVIPHPKGQ